MLTRHTPQPATAHGHESACGVHVKSIKGMFAASFCKPTTWSLSSPYLRAGALPDADNAVLVGVEDLANLQTQQSCAQDSQR